MSTSEGQTTRSYDGTGRQRDAQLRRRRIIDAAQALFLEHGYGATAIDQIAAAAGVSAQTVYSAFGSKAGILHQIIDVAIAGEDHAEPTPTQRARLVALGHADLAARVRGLAHLARLSNERSAPIFRIAWSVAGADADVGRVVDDLRQRQRLSAQAIVGAFSDEQFVPGMTAQQAADIAYFTSYPSAWNVLVVECGWTGDQYEQWLGDTMLHQLFGIETGQAGTTSK